MTNPLSPELIAFGATFIPAAVQPGQPYWRLTQASGPFEWGGRISIFVDVRGEAGQRLVGVRVQLSNGGLSYKATEPKPGDDFAVDFPMYAANNAYGVLVADGLPSDSIHGMGLIPFKPHVVYKLIFQRTIADGAPPVPPTGPAPLTAREAIERAISCLEMAKGLLP